MLVTLMLCALWALLLLAVLLTYDEDGANVEDDATEWTVVTLTGAGVVL